MFDFENLFVYQSARDLNIQFMELLNRDSLDRTTGDQLRRASLSIMLNIAEGSGRFTNRDRRRFYIIARGSVFECVAIIDFLNVSQSITTETMQAFYTHLEEISKMLFAMIRKLE